jgi:hypothetical protein
MVWTKFLTTCYGILVNSGCNTVLKIYIYPKSQKNEDIAWVKLMRMSRKSRRSG